MYQPGMDQGLAQIRYNDMLEAAAQERAERKPRADAPKAVARRLALAAVAPVALGIVWMLAAH